MAFFQGLSGRSQVLGRDFALPEPDFPAGSGRLLPNTGLEVRIMGGKGLSATWLAEAAGAI
jgi:hypothetical protein